MFSGDKEFGEWVSHHQLDGPDDMSRLAAMWAAADVMQFNRRSRPRQ